MKPVRKVWVPTLLGLAVGLVLVFAGHEDSGLAVLLSALGYGGVGYAVPHAD